MKTNPTLSKKKGWGSDKNQKNRRKMSRGLPAKLPAKLVGESERKFRCIGLFTSEKAALILNNLARDRPTPTLSAS
jgi:hypothetical protein